MTISKFWSSNRAGISTSPAPSSAIKFADHSARVDISAEWQQYIGHMAGTSFIVAVLGGPKTFPISIRRWFDLHRSIEQGLRYRAVDSLHDRYGLSNAEITVLLAVPSRTLARRKQQDRFQPQESDRLVRLGRIGALAEETLGDPAKAASWLRRPNRALENETPLSQLDTDVGTRQVENILLRVAHGVYS